MASRSLGTLTLDLVARIGGFTSALTKAEREADKRFKGIESAAKKMGLALGAGIAAAGAAAAIGVKNAIDFADKLNDMNMRLGVSAEALSGWAYAAKQSGTDIDALGIGLKKLAKNMTEALDPKSMQGKLFEALGVSITDASGKLRSVEDVLPEVATKFKELDNATLESAIAMDLFGKSGTDLLEFLNNGSDGLATLRDRARDLGVELDGNTLQAADRFNDTLGDIKTISEGLWSQLAAALLPALIEVAEMMRDGAQKGSSFGDTFSFIGDKARAAVAELRAFADDVQRLGELMDAAFKPRGGVQLKRYNELQAAKAGKRGASLAASGVDAAFDAIEQQRSALAASGVDAAFGLNARAPSAMEARLNRAYGPDTKAGKKAKAKKAGKTDAEREAEQLKAAYDRMNASLAEQVAMFGETGQAAKLRYDLENGELAKLTQAQKDGLIAQAEKLDQMEQTKKTQDAVIEALEKEKDAVEGVFARLEDERAALTLSNVELAKRNALLGLSAEAQAEWGDAISQNIEELERMHEQSAFMDGVRDTFNGFFMDVFTGTKSIKDAFKDLFDNIAQMITQKIVNGWLDKLFGMPGTTGAGSSGGDFFGKLLGAIFGGANAKGNAFSGGSVTAFANGGVISAPQMFPMAGGRMGLMGEAGPEAIMPLTRGSDGKLGVRSHGRSSNTTNIIVQGTATKATIRQIERGNGIRAQREMARNG